MKRYREGKFLEQIRNIPNISLACEKVGLSRNTVYRWCKEDSAFKKRLDGALKTGVESVCDLAESKLVGHINNGNLQAIRYWFDNNKRSYARPRPKSFWEEILRRDGPVTGITFTAVDPIKVEEIKKANAQKQSQTGLNEPLG